MHFFATFAVYNVLYAYFSTSGFMSRLFVISDIHGCFRPFYEMVTNTIKLTRSDELILLGDYIDRGENSKEVIDFIIDLRNRGFNITVLTGNHEQMLLDAWSDPGALYQWYMNSGMTTLFSFGIQDIMEMDTSYIDFFKNLEFYKEIGKYIFVHAGFNDYISDPFSDKHTMIWECSTRYDNPVLSGRTIIHGHRPKTIDYVKKCISGNSNVIPIDTGCVYEKEMGYGNLSALEVDTMNLFSIPYI
jgi:serine/threonine protein phosphatase 1